MSRRKILDDLQPLKDKLKIKNYIEGMTCILITFAKYKKSGEMSILFRAQEEKPILHDWNTEVNACM
jgi:hypothetical protein